MTWFKKDPLQIISFRGYGTSKRFYARGRALEDEAIDLNDQGLWHLIINTWKRFESDEIKNVDIELTLPNGKSFITSTDNHGYFKLDTVTEDLNNLTEESQWLSFTLKYLHPDKSRVIQNKNCFNGEMLIPSKSKKYGVISDIDDTILHTGVVSVLKWKVIYNSVFKHAKHRTPLEGAAEFYNLLHKGKSNSCFNPIFYVSHSPWNLYRYLELFLKQHNFPKGPLLLRSFDNIFKNKWKKSKPQKHQEIEALLHSYPKTNFILIGDSGENDPYIYTQIAEDFPGRILSIYLRSVSHNKKMHAVRTFIASKENKDILIVNNSSEAIEHAKQKGFI